MTGQGKKRVTENTFVLGNKCREMLGYWVWFGVNRCVLMNAPRRVFMGSK
jgi:hypothetical protein